ncbi:MAG: hypothetical protein SFZ23_14670 [Planctomycetota bacterium]|nr:hypothetical protein [Planctomycetota bacterium]
MKEYTMPCRPALIVALGTSCSGALAQFEPVDLTAVYNTDRHLSCCDSWQYPLGNATYLGIPFFLGPETGNNSVFMDGVNPVVTDIQIDRVGVQRVRTLLNTAWGQPGPASYLRIEFHGVDSSVYAIDLVGNVHIRDHGPCCTAFIDPNPPTCTRNVWVSSSGQVRADMQTFALPAAIRSGGLDFVRFIDNGAIGFQRGYLFAMTLDYSLCEANINDDCIVDFFDYLDFVARYANEDQEADFNADGVIDFFDYLDFAQAFSEGC